MAHSPESPGVLTRLLERMGISGNRGAHVEPQLGRGELPLVNHEALPPRSRPAVPAPAVPAPAVQRPRPGSSRNEARGPQYPISGPRDLRAMPVPIPRRPARRGTMHSPNFGRISEEGEFRPGGPPRGPREPRLPLALPPRLHRPSHAAPPVPPRRVPGPPRLPPLAHVNPPSNQERVARPFDLPGNVSGFRC